MRSLQSLMMRCINDAHLLSPRGFNNSRRGAAPASVSSDLVVPLCLWIDCAGCGGGKHVCLPLNDRHLSVSSEADSKEEGREERGGSVLRQESHQLSSTWKLLRVKILETSAGCTCCCCCLIEFLNSHTGRDAHTPKYTLRPRTWSIMSLSTSALWPRRGVSSMVYGQISAHAWAANCLAHHSKSTGTNFTL